MNDDAELYITAGELKQWCNESFDSGYQAALCALQDAASTAYQCARLVVPMIETIDPRASA